MPKFTASFVAALLAATPCQFGFASQERILRPSEVSVVADSGDLFGLVSVTIREKEQRVESIALEVGGKVVPVPPAAYKDLQSPILSSLEVRTDRGFDKDPWLYVCFNVANTDNQPPIRCRITYRQGRIVSRSLDYPEPNGSTERKVVEFQVME